MKAKANSIRETGVGSAGPNLFVKPARMKHWRFAVKSFWISTQALLQKRARWKKVI